MTRPPESPKDGAGGHPPSTPSPPTPRLWGLRLQTGPTAHLRWGHPALLTSSFLTVTQVAANDSVSKRSRCGKLAEWRVRSACLIMQTLPPGARAGDRGPGSERACGSRQGVDLANTKGDQHGPHSLPGCPRRRPLALPRVPVVGSLPALGQPQPGRWPSRAWAHPQVTTSWLCDPGPVT